MKDCFIRFTSKQSFFLCVMAPQFSQAPLRNLVVTELCWKKTKMNFNFRVHLIWIYESDLLIRSHLLHSSLIPLADVWILFLIFSLWSLMLQCGPFGRVDVPRHWWNILRDVRVNVPGEEKKQKRSGSYYSSSFIANVTVKGHVYGFTYNQFYSDCC